MKKSKNDNLKIGLALGGGAALGFAHIGVIKVLEENGIKIDYIAGTSMGSVIGVLYACGLTIDQMLEEVKKFDIKQITKFNGFRVLKEGLYNTQKMESYIENITGIDKLENTKIPFRCNAVDLYTGQEYVFKKGKLGEAIRASTAIPGLFKSVIKDNKFLVDGGVVNNNPFNIVKDMGADFIIAVDVVPKYVQKDKINNVVKIIMNSFGLLQNRHEIEKRSHLKENGYLIEISSKKDEQDYSQESIQFACKLGEEIALKHIEKIKKEIRHFKRQLNKKDRQTN